MKIRKCKDCGGKCKVKKQPKFICNPRIYTARCKNTGQGCFGNVYLGYTKQWAINLWNRAMEINYEDK